MNEFDTIAIDPAFGISEGFFDTVSNFANIAIPKQTNENRLAIYGIVDSSDSNKFKLYQMQAYGGSLTNPLQRFLIHTKDIDFDQPGVNKKIYKVYITYKSGGDSLVSVKYGVEGITTPASTFDESASTNYSSSTLDDTGSEWAVAKLIPTSSINNIKSFKLSIESAMSADVPGSFAINDITIIYRLKSPK